MKTAIIGAGINGLYLAWKLSEKGINVTVFEKRDAIGKEACSGLFSERIFKFIPQSQKLIINQINFVLIHFPRKTIKVNFAKKFFVMNHAELDRLVADLAIDSGASIKLNETRYDRVSFERIIGCDGASSEIRKSLGLPEPSYRLGILGFTNVTRSDRVSSFVETWPVRNGFTPHHFSDNNIMKNFELPKSNANHRSGAGFIWKIPRGEELEYGIIANTGDAKKLLDDFCLKNNLRLQNIKSALIPQGLIIPKSNKITLCGDAAGLTKPWSGGGVIWGLQAANLLLKNFPDLLRYRQEAKRFFAPEIALSKTAVKAVYFLGFCLPWLLPKKARMEGDYALRHNHGR